jgi:putative peptidoglycan lipid II flippase
VSDTLGTNVNDDRPRRSAISDNLAVALGTALSRLTGFARLITLAYVLIPAAKVGADADGRLADVYNLANTAPNIIYDLVIGGALTATLVPRFTKALAEDDRRAIDAIVTVSLLALGALTVVATLAAPLIIRVYTSLSSGDDARQYDQVATSLAYIFLPQIMFYGATTVFSALLNARGRFFAAAWAPVLTNVVTIVGLLYVAQAYSDVTIEHVASSGSLRFAIGIGATIGVAAMAGTLVPAIVRSGVAPRFLPDLRHPAVREVMRLSTWTFGYVIANQVSLLVITVVALREVSDYAAYTSMYLLLQLPHGLLAVTLMTTYTPRLTRAHVVENTVLFRTLVRAGVRVIVGLLLPAAVLFVAAPSAASALTGNFAELGSSPAVLRGFGVGLVAFSVYLFLLRGFYAMQDTRTPFMINAVQNGANVVLAVVLGFRWHAAGLAWAFSLSYIGAAVLTWFKLDNAVRGGLRLELLAPGLVRAFVAALPMAVAVWAIVGAMDPVTVIDGIEALLVAGVIGGACYFATLGALGGMRPRRALPARRR